MTRAQLPNFVHRSTGLEFWVILKFDRVFVLFVLIRVLAAPVALSLLPP